MSARILSIVSISTLRGFAGGWGAASLADADGPAALTTAGAVGEGTGAGVPEGGSLLVQARVRSARASGRMLPAVLLGLDLSFQTIELTFQILLGNAVFGLGLHVFRREHGAGA